MFEKSVCSWVKLGPDEREKRQGFIDRKDEKEMSGELTGGDFVAEAKEAKLVIWIAPPSVRAGGYIGRRAKPDSREAVIGQRLW
jgi:hypothetical protein